MSAQVERAWAGCPATERASGAILAHNYGAKAQRCSVTDAGLPTILSGHLSWQYRHPSQLPERFVLTVGYAPRGLELLCDSLAAARGYRQPLASG